MDDSQERNKWSYPPPIAPFDASEIFSQAAPSNAGTVNSLDVARLWAHRSAYGLPAAPAGFAAEAWKGRQIEFANNKNNLTFRSSDGFRGASKAMLVSGSVGLFDNALNSYFGGTGEHPTIFRSSLPEMFVVGLASSIGGIRAKIALTSLSWLVGRVYNYFWQS